MKQPSLKYNKHHLLFKIVLCLLITIILVQSEQLINHKSAYAYSCGSWTDINANRCYATTEFLSFGNGYYAGSKTDIDIWQLSCTQECTADGFILQDMWLGQRTNTSCLANRCWIEAGHMNESPTSQYFWADNRPGAGGYHIHYGTNVTSNDIQYGVLHEEIYQNGAGTFEIWRQVYFCSSCTTFAPVYSTTNSMSPDYAVIGTELAGYGSGASSPNTHFKTNYWLDKNTGIWNPQNRSFGSTVNSPVSGHWNIAPSSSSTGDWVTHCC